MNTNTITFTDEDFSPLPDRADGCEKMLREPSSYGKDVWRSFCKRKTAVVSLIVMGIMVVMVIIGPMLSQYDYYSNDYTASNVAPNMEHWFGTDTLGRDLWTRAWVGGRVSLLIAILSTIFPYLIGMTIGGISGYIGGAVDMIIMRTIDVLMGIPDLIYMILLMIVLGSGSIWTLVIVFSLTGWMGSARSTRALEILRLISFPDPERSLKRYPHQLSGGMRQRIMIAMALICDPQVLFADEPTTALDVTIQAQIIDLMKDLKHKIDSSIVLITHDMGVVGESGCGKSTLGKSILRLYRPDAGEIRYRGKNIWTYNRKERKNFRKEVQMIFQDPYASLDPLNIIHDVIEEGMLVHHLYPDKGKREERILTLLKMVGLGEEHMYRFPHEFSGGQRQRIGIARALSVEPELVVCDEPISALDVCIQAQVVNLLKELQQQMGMTYVFITHDLSMVKYISDRIAVMYLGGIAELADSQTLFNNPMHSYTQALISAIPVADPKKEKTRERVLLTGDVPSPVNLGPGCAFSGRCGHACEKCREKKPDLMEVGPGHFVACHKAKGEI